jgi:hypothetical protein
MSFGEQATGALSLFFSSLEKGYLYEIQAIFNPANGLALLRPGHLRGRHPGWLHRSKDAHRTQSVGQPRFGELHQAGRHAQDSKKRCGR